MIELFQRSLDLEESIELQYNKKKKVPNQSTRITFQCLKDYYNFGFIPIGMNPKLQSS